jgi:CheY-like chemotaxis protein
MIDKTIIDLLGTVIWPVFGIFAILMFRGPLADLLQRSNQTSLKLPGGIELNLNRVAASAAAAGAALGKQAAEENQTVPEKAFQNIAEGIAAAHSTERRQQARILWVDDNPPNNRSLVNAFQSLGIQVFEALDTEEAKHMFSQGSYDVIITDMGRPSSPEAGKALVSYLKEQNITTPVIIYAARWARQHRGEEKNLGVAAITNDPSMVYSTALQLIQNAGQPLRDWRQQVWAGTR